LSVKFKNIVFILTISFIGFHFIATYIFCLPDSYFPDPVNYYSRKYINPAFNQGWSMFAPDPPLKEKWTEFRWASDGEWKDWYRTDTLYQDEFHKYRITHHNNMHLMIQNASAYLWGESWKADNMPNSISDQYDGDSLAYLKESYGYLLSMHLVEQVIKNHCNTDLHTIDSLELRLKLRDPFIQTGKSSIDTSTYYFPIRTYSQ